MIFTNTKKPAPPVIHDAVGIKHGRVRGDGFRRFPRALSVQPLIGKIRKVHDAFGNAIRPASVFMDSRANVQRGRSEGAQVPIAIPLDNRIPPAFIGTAFDPEHPISIESDLSESDGF